MRKSRSDEKITDDANKIPMKNQETLPLPHTLIVPSHAIPPNFTRFQQVELGRCNYAMNMISHIRQLSLHLAIILPHFPTLDSHPPHFRPFHHPHQFLPQLHPSPIPSPNHLTCSARSHPVDRRNRSMRVRRLASSDG